MLGRRILSGVPVPGAHGGGRPLFAGPGDTGTMLRPVNWLSRALGFAWVGVLAFVLAPPPETSAVLVQVAGYCLLGLALVAWGVLEAHPVSARYHAVVPAVLRGVIAGLLIGRNWGGYRVQAEQATQLLAQREELQAEQRRADLLDERARIAREIHDVLAHSLGALGIQIQAARAVLSDHADIEKANEILAGAQRMAAEGLVDTRRAVHALRTDTLPLDEELARVSDTYAQRYHVAASFDVGGVPGPLPPDATIALLRIAQESLVNAAKHAAGQSVAVRLDYSDTDVRLTVRNDLPPGTGPDGEAGVSTVNGGYGLTGMRERLRLLNGTLQAGRRDNQWIVTAELPRSQPENVPS